MTFILSGIFFKITWRKRYEKWFTQVERNCHYLNGHLNVFILYAYYNKSNTFSYIFGLYIALLSLHIVLLSLHIVLKFNLFRTIWLLTTYVNYYVLVMSKKEYLKNWRRNQTELQNLFEEEIPALASFRGFWFWKRASESQNCQCKW